MIRPERQPSTRGGGSNQGRPDSANPQPNGLSSVHGGGDGETSFERMRADAARSNIRLELARAGALGRGLRGRAAGRSLGLGPGKFLEPGRLEGPDAVRGGTDIESRSAGE